MTLIAHWKLDEASGTYVVDTTGNVPNLDIVGTPTFSVDGVDGTAIAFGGGAEVFHNNRTTPSLAGIGAVTVSGWIKATDNSQYNWLIKVYRNSNYNFYFVQLTGGALKFYGNAGSSTDFETTTDAAVDLAGGVYVHIAASIDLTSGVRKIYVNGVQVATTDAGIITATTFDFSGAFTDMSIGHNSATAPLAIDDVRLYSTALSDAEVLALYEEFADSTIAAASIPLLLTGGLLSGSAVLPMWLRTSELAGASSVPMKLQAPDPAHYQATKAKWDVQVLLDNVDISDRLVGLIEISHEESASGTCTVRMIPAAGAIDPDAFERKPLVIEFQGKNDAGTIIYASRRFTGISSGAIYDPDAGIVAIEGTTDLQGRIENMSRDTIAALVGGEWSGHVFDEDADNWQYAQDRLSTTPTEIHANRFGSIVAAPWAAKATADIELTDADIEDKQFTIARTKRRDLVTRVRINLDFRFVRLRHREVQVNFANSFGFCHYLNWNWPLCSRDMVRSAADSNEWVRITDIAFIGLPVAGTYCTPSRGWVGGADAFCLGASWRSAMRWAQTVTEEYAIDVVATDLEEAVGQQQVAESYGIEATYDGNDFEAVKAYSTSPLGAVFSTVTDDWQKEATDSERDGRAAMEYAQEVAIARARTTMLDRARRNRLTVYPVYDPSIDIDQTVRVATTYLTAKGKVAAMREMMDTSDGDIVMAVEIALSRHGGTGLASDDPIEAAEQPDQPTEEPTPRVYYVPYRMGGLVNAPQDDDEWDGYMTNVQESLRDPSGGVYQQRLVLKMPAIEESARDAQAIPQTASFEVEIPEDELTMSY